MAGGEPVVVITGAAAGIGAALARRYARDGAKLALLDRDLAGIEALGAEALGASHAPLAVRCDVTNASTCDQAIEDVVKHFGRIDILINNAGITHVSPFAETDPEVIRRVMDVNFYGALYCTKAALPHLVSSRGRIAVMSSVAGFAPLALRTGYAASKHALHGLFESLRSEIVETGVSITMVCPSFVRTAIGDKALGADGGPREADRSEVGGAMEPDTVAAQIHRAVQRRQRTLLVGRVGKLSYWLSRLLPSVYERIMTASQRTT
ncbi:MAG: SDR family oxidoreductase [bacterium]|nr:SDR family oxidoreductase [bacterium]